MLQNKKELDSVFQNNQSLFIGNSHKDAKSHEWVLKYLAKHQHELKYFFVETNQEYMKELIDFCEDKGIKVKDAIIEGRSLEDINKQFHTTLKLKNLAYTFLKAHYQFPNLQVVGIDQVSEEDRKFLNEKKTNPDPNIQEQCFQIRIKYDPFMRNNVEEHLNNNPNHKYIILGGAAHIGLASLLDIKSIVLFDHKYFAETLPSLLGLLNRVNIHNVVTCKDNGEINFVNEGMLSMFTQQIVETIKGAVLKEFSNLTKDLKRPIKEHNELSMQVQMPFQIGSKTIKDWCNKTFGYHLANNIEFSKQNEVSLSLDKNCRDILSTLLSSQEEENENAEFTVPEISVSDTQ